MIKDVIDFKIKKEDKLDKEYEYKNLRHLIFALTIPEGFDIDFFPENVNLEYGKYKAYIKYKRKGNLLIYEHDIIFDFLVLKTEEHKDFNKFIKKLDKAYKESVVLKKKQ